MPKRFTSLLMVFACGLLVGWLGANASQPAPPSAQAHVPSRAISMVDKAYRMITEDGLFAFNAMDKDPGFYQDGLYLFVLSADGENLYHSADRTLVGQDFSGKRDVKNRPYGQRLIRDTAAQGVWHAYEPGNTASGKPQWKLTYARQTDRGHIIAAGIFARAPH